MNVSGFTIVKDAVEYDYPFKEAERKKKYNSHELNSFYIYLWSLSRGHSKSNKGK